MEIITINVGQGSFAVVRDQDEAIVVDTRIPAVGDSTAEFVKGALSGAVRDHNVRGLVLTGFDRDHADASGVAIVLRKYRPDWIMYPRYYKNTDEAREVFAIIDGEERSRRGTRTPLDRYSIRLDKVESRIYRAGGLCERMSFELFSPHPEDMESSNDCSLVVKVRDDSMSYLITGDTETGRWDTIARLFRSDLKSDVLAAPHHGSDTGLHEGALGHIRPDTVLVSAGKDNQYGHPHAKAMLTYRLMAREVHSTHTGDSLHTYRGRRGIETAKGTITRG